MENVGLQIGEVVLSVAKKSSKNLNGHVVNRCRDTMDVIWSGYGIRNEVVDANGWESILPDWGKYVAYEELA